MGEKVKKAFVDYGIEKMMSRKLLVFIMTTIFFLLGFIPAATWEMIAVAYVGTQGFVDIIHRWREGR